MTWRFWVITASLRLCCRKLDRRISASVESVDDGIRGRQCLERLTPRHPSFSARRGNTAYSCCEITRGFCNAVIIVVLSLWAGELHMCLCIVQNLHPIFVLFMSKKEHPNNGKSW